MDTNNPHDLAQIAGGIRHEFSEVAVREAGSIGEAISKAAECEVLIAGAPAINQALVDAMPHLRWIQALTTGTDNIQSMTFRERPILTSTRGVHGPQMSELALLLMLAAVRNFPRMLDNQAHQKWERWPQPMLFGKTLVILGVGTIAEALAIRCRAMGMRVIGVSARRTEVPGFDRIVGRNAMEEAAAEADFLVVLLPDSPENRMAVGTKVFQRLKPGTIFINIARGGVVDEDALCKAIDTGRVGWAALDVFSTEPLPSESPLWRMPRVIVTPHIGGASDQYAAQVLPIVIENLRAYTQGRKDLMRNVVW